MGDAQHSAKASLRSTHAVYILRESLSSGLSGRMLWVQVHTQTGSNLCHRHNVVVSSSMLISSVPATAPEKLPANGCSSTQL